MNIFAKNKNLRISHNINLKHIIIRLAGDSGDGIQLTGERLAKLSAVMGNNVVTSSDYPSEIRAPSGSLEGISGYQMSIGSMGNYTSGNKVDLLVAMNPSAFKLNLELMKKGSIIIINAFSFTKKNCMKAKLSNEFFNFRNMLNYKIISINMNNLLKVILKSIPLTSKEKERCKNFLALGIVCWLLNRKSELTTTWIEKKFKHKKLIVEGNILSLQAGLKYCNSNNIFGISFNIRNIKKNSLIKGAYTYISGNTAIAWGLICAAKRADRKLFLGSYPITPATPILQLLSSYRQLEVFTYQAEDEIAGIGTSLGASFVGALSATSTSGPGVSLKGEFINLAVAVELPLIVINIQRCGPSTGLPTKNEQSDLLQALWGRHGESPLVVIAAKTPNDCFYSTYEAARIACKYMTPVILLSDSYLANGSENWRIPTMKNLPSLEIVNHMGKNLSKTFHPYKRFKNTLSRPWIVPGVKYSEHRLGGLEQNEFGNTSSDSINHQKMCIFRHAKISNVAQEIPFPDFYGNKYGKILLLSWGSTFGVVRQVSSNLIKQGKHISHCHLRFLNPLSLHLKHIFSAFCVVITIENNLGQLYIKIKSEMGGCIKRINQMHGKPLTAEYIESYVKRVFKLLEI